MVWRRLRLGPATSQWADVFFEQHTAQTAASGVSGMTRARMGPAQAQNRCSGLGQSLVGLQRALCVCATGWQAL